MIGVLWALFVVYAFVLIRAAVTWALLPSGSRFFTPDSTAPFVSVIVAARNEARAINRLLQSLAAQSFAHTRFEIILVDDHSTDGTAEVAIRVAKELALQNMKVVYLEQVQAGKGKKAAITAGINVAVGQFICLTDADCIVPPVWLSEMVGTALNTQSVLVSGPVAFSELENTLARLQAVEFAGLVAMGGASVQLGQPNMCNGANLLFTEAAFNTVDGYAGNEHVASGDDEFLLHKIAAVFPGRYAFLKSVSATVVTKPCLSFNQLLRQRIRWASKWQHYKGLGPKLLALLVAGFYAMLAVSLAFALAGWLKWEPLLWLFCAKFGAEAIFLWPALSFFKIRRLFWLTLPLQVLQPLFVLLVGLCTLRGNYQWKGRSIHI